MIRVIGACLRVDRELRIQFAMRTVSEANSHTHWRLRQKRAKDQRETTMMVMGASFSKPALPCVVKLTRISPRTLDDDNLCGALKHVRDGVADWLGIDDRDGRVRWEYAQEKGPAKAYAVRVEVRAA